MHNAKLDTTMMSWVQEKADLRERNRKAISYSKRVERRNKKKLSDKAITLIAITLGIATFSWVAVDAFELKPSHAANVATEQEYIVRYGTVNGYDTTNGDMLIKTQDGNLWAMQDAPCYDNGTEVRVLFDSNATTIATDDVIIDITVR